MKKTKTPLARKIEGYSPSSDFAKFEAFEARKSRKKLVWFWPILAVSLIILGLSSLFELNHESQKSTSNTNIPQTLTPNHPDTKTSDGPITSQDLIEQSTNSQPLIENLNNQKAKAYAKTEHPTKHDSGIQPSEEILNSSPIHFAKLVLQRKSVEAFAYRINGANAILPLNEFIPMTPEKRSNPPFSPSWIVSIGPNLASNRLVLAADASDYIHPDFAKILNNTVHSDVGLSINITYSKPIYKGLSVYTGLGFTGNKLTGYYKFSLDSIPVFDIDNTIAGFVQLASTSPLRNMDLGSANQSFNFITLPIGLSYSTTLKKYLFDAAIGTDLSYLTNARGNILDGQIITESRKLTDVINPKYASLHTRISVFRNVSETISGGLTFGYSLQTNSLYNQPHYTIKNSAAEIHAVIKFNLLKN